jgi:hypothetical protein
MPPCAFDSERDLIEVAHPAGVVGGRWEGTMQSFSAKHEMWEEKEGERGRERTKSGRDGKQPTIDLLSQRRSDAHNRRRRVEART